MSLSITTPKEISAKVSDFCGSLSPFDPVYVRVTPDEGATPKQCFFNVKRLVELRDCEAVFGWMIWQAGDLWLEAEHHAVLRLPSGEFIDPTPQLDGEQLILFARDDLLLFNYATPRRKLRKFYNLAQSDAVGFFLDAEMELEKFLWQRSRFVGEICVPTAMSPKELRAYEKLLNKKRMREVALAKALNK